MDYEFTKTSLERFIRDLKRDMWGEIAWEAQLKSWNKTLMFLMGIRGQDFLDAFADKKKERLISLCEKAYNNILKIDNHKRKTKQL